MEVGSSPCSHFLGTSGSVRVRVVEMSRYWDVSYVVTWGCDGGAERSGRLELVEVWRCVCVTPVEEWGCDGGMVVETLRTLQP